MARPSAASPPKDTGSSGLRFRHTSTSRSRLSGRICKQLPNPGNHLTSVELDGRQLLFVGYSPRGAGKIESAEPEPPDDRRHLGGNRFRRPEIQRSAAISAWNWSIVGRAQPRSAAALSSTSAQCGPRRAIASWSVWPRSRANAYRSAAAGIRTRRELVIGSPTDDGQHQWRAVTGRRITDSGLPSTP
jgi:hypothetical protein